MGVFYQEDPPNSSRKCFLATAFKDAFCHCRNFSRRLPESTQEDEYPASDFGDEEEEIVSEIRSRAMEKLRRKNTLLTESFPWVLSPATKELYLTSMEFQKDDSENEENEGDEFFSVKSFLTYCSSGASKEAFLSMKSNFSRCSSLNGVDFVKEEVGRRSILQEFCHCEGWPFGLCRKPVLLPPLPKSPAESWSWSKGTKVVKTY